MEKNHGDEVEDLEADLCESREFDDVIVGEQEARKQEDVANATSPLDAGSDQPTSIKEVHSEEIQPTKPSLHEVLVDITGLEPGGHAVDSGTSTSASVNNREEPTMQEEETQFSDIDTSMSGLGDVSIDENMPTLLSDTIDCPAENDLVPSGTIFQSPSNERQRPSRNAYRPSRYRDSNFETQFQPVKRRRNCRKIQKRSQTGYDVSNVGKYQDFGRGERKENITPTGSKITSLTSDQKTRKTVLATCIDPEKEARQKQRLSLKTGRHPQFITNFHQHSPKEALANARPPGNTSQQAPSELCTMTDDQDSEINVLNSSLEKASRKSIHEGKNKNSRHHYPPGNGNRIKSATPTTSTTGHIFYNDATIC